jgi:hypothetical protein
MPASGHEPFFIRVKLARSNFPLEPEVIEIRFQESAPASFLRVTDQFLHTYPSRYAILET